MHLSYGISLPLQICTRNRISSPKNVQKSHIKMTKTLQYTLPFFVTNRQRVKKKQVQEMKVQTMIMMHDGCEMNEKMKFKPKTKQNATKYKINMIC